MAAGTGAAVIIKPVRNRALHWIRNVALVIRTVQIDTIPARGKRNNVTDPPGAEFLGQRHAIGGSTVQIVIIPALGHASVAHFRVGFSLLRGAPETGVSDEHAEARLESSRLVTALRGD